MDITIQDQLWQIFLSCGMGFFLGILYDVFRVARLVMNSKKLSVFVQDILFFMLAAVITFLFSLVIMDGNLRLFLFLGEIVGFFIYHYTVGRLVIRFARGIIEGILRAWHIFWRIITAPFRWMGRLVRPLYDRFAGFVQKKAHNVLNIFKKGLKPLADLLDNRKETK